MIYHGDDVFSEKEILESATPTHAHSVFYDVVTVLAAHVITAATEAELSKSQI